MACRTGLARACSVAAVVWLVVLSSMCGRSHAAGSDDGSVGADIEAIKEHFGFADWAGKTEIPNDVIPKLTFSEGSLKALGSVAISTVAADRDRTSQFSIAPSDAESGATVSVDLHDSPLGAHEAFMRYFTTVSVPLTLFERLKRGTPVDIGDVCIVYKPTWHVPGVHQGPFYASVMFARNNALVRIEHDGLAEGKRSLDLLPLARAIDLQLVMMGRYGRLALAGDEIDGLKVERTARWWGWPGAKAAGLPEYHYVLEQTFGVGESSGWLVISAFDDETVAEKAARAWLKDVAVVFQEGLWQGAHPEGLGDRRWYNSEFGSLGLMVQAGDVSFLISVRATSAEARRETALALARAIAKRAAQPRESDDPQTKPGAVTSPS